MTDRYRNLYGSDNDGLAGEIVEETRDDRFMWLHLYYGQVKSLRLYRYDHTTDYPTYRRAWRKLLFIYLTPVLFAGLTAWRTNSLKDISDLTVGVLGLLIGALLAVFSQLSGWRDRYPSEDGADTWVREPTRRLLDTSSTQMLAACQSALVAVIILLAAIALNPTWVWVLKLFAAFVVLFTTHAVCSMIIAVPYLYAAYVQVHDIDGKYDGFNRMN